MFCLSVCLSSVCESRLRQPCNAVACFCTFSHSDLPSRKPDRWHHALGTCLHCVFASRKRERWQHAPDIGLHSDLLSHNPDRWRHELDNSPLGAIPRSLYTVIDHHRASITSDACASYFGLFWDCSLLTCLAHICT